ncbi:MAG: hypothetical protein IPL46_10890 [Saprospiraceae bacterium]|nr:hypothetical protein [Saprospiraceae bacterium]
MLLDKYPAKILLFGEYTVLFGGEALAIPYPKYGGSWTKQVHVHEFDFSNLITYLTQNNYLLNSKLDLTALKHLIESNYIFQSDIPEGIGLGSSAALCASIYDQFAKHNPLSLEHKKHDLAIIESFYHGKSSGFDALVSLQKKSIVLSQAGLREYQKLARLEGYAYLLLTGVRRHTQSLVQTFNTACQLPAFKKQMELLATKSQECIQQYVNSRNIFETLSEVSSLQSRFLDFLIIPSLKEIWQKGLEEQSYYLKICGAGGGGAYLVFSREKMDRSALGDFRLEEIGL